MERITVYHPPSDGPPPNELPVAVAAPELVWHGDGIVYAIPSLEVYTTGAELHILFRTAQVHFRSRVEQAARDALTFLTVNGSHLTPLGGGITDHGFSYRAWKDWPSTEVSHDLAFALKWPEIAPAEHRISGAVIVRAVSRVTTLW